MKKGLYKISCNKEIALRTMSMRLEGDSSSFSKGGQFADIAIDGYFLRRPIAVTEWDSDGFSIIYKIVGKGTESLSRLKAGQELDVLTGLGNGFDASLCDRRALLVSGGLGASPLFSLARELIASGKEVTVVMGFNKADEVILTDEYKALGAEVLVITMDGSVGLKGLVTDGIATLGKSFDHFYTCGPKVMMKAVCKALDIPGEASLEERMGCGCGICYGCTCHTTKGPRRICADGPVFSKEDIIW